MMWYVTPPSREGRCDFCGGEATFTVYFGLQEAGRLCPACRRKVVIPDLKDLVRWEEEDEGRSEIHSR